jgi:DNA-binding MarR family transcriptional regulator
MLKYTVKNFKTGEVKEWEAEQKKAHRTLREVVKAAVTAYPGCQVVIEIEGADKEVVATYKEKAANYLEKANGGAVKKAPKVKAPVANELEGVMTTIAEAHKNGLLTVLESKAMDYILTKGFWNGEWGFSDIEVSDIADGMGIEVSSAKGVVGSLVKKDYLEVSQAEGGVPPLVYATETGYELDENFETKWKPQIW